MNFQSIPERILVQIIGQLPFKERIRIGRVNKCFKRLSDIVVSETETLDLGDPIFERWVPPRFCRYLELFSDKLKTMKFAYSEDAHSGSSIESMVLAFSKYSYPRLEELDLGYAKIGKFMFGQIVSGCPNLKTLVWYEVDKSLTYPAGVVNEKLEKLAFDFCDDAMFRSLACRFPNLKDLAIRKVKVNSGEALDHFLATCPGLETLFLKDMTSIDFDDMQHLWSLKKLKKFIIRVDSLDQTEDDDDVLINVMESFPQLEVLGLPYLTMTNYGVEALAHMEKLRVLKLGGNGGIGGIDQGIAAIAKRGRLQQAVFYESVSVDTFLILIRQNPELSYLWIESVDDVDSPDEAAGILESIGTNTTQDLSILISEYDDFQNWRSEKAEAVLKSIKENGGRAITFGYGMTDTYVLKPFEFDERLPQETAVIPGCPIS